MRNLWDRGKTASQQEGSKALEAIAIAFEEVLTRGAVDNTEIDKCIRLHSAGLDWDGGLATVFIYLIKSFDSEFYEGKTWSATHALIRQPQLDDTRVREIFIEFSHLPGKHNSKLRMPVAKIIRDQLRNCEGAINFKSCDCTDKNCEFNRKWNDRYTKFLSTCTLEHRTMRAKYGGPGHM